MEVAIVTLFVLGYLFISLEHPLKVNKAGTALLTGTLLWVLYTFSASDYIPTVSAHEFEIFLLGKPQYADLPFAEQCLHFVLDFQIVECLGGIASTIFFLIGAMVTVELVDVHGGFLFITNRITTKNKRRILFMVTVLTFFMSAVLDNLTTSIVMVMLVSKWVGNFRERWVFGSMIVIAANSGGAWSPIGDVTTIMLWVHGNISAWETISHLWLPSIVSVAVPLAILLPALHGNVTPPNVPVRQKENAILNELKTKERLSILILGLCCLLFVPIFKGLTHLPPFMGILLGVGVLWIYTDIMYRRKSSVDESIKLRLSKVVQRIDWTTLLFFIGILLAVDTLRFSGILGSFAAMLDRTVGNVLAIDVIIGMISAIVDNVPIVAGAIGMYPVINETMLATAADPVYAANFLPDGAFWQFLAYCAGVGGSILLLGSAAGVVVMGLVRIPFFWYLKRITWIASAGYLSGALVYYLQTLILN
ncbi:MAG: sodium:proton antiporter [Tannerellaceae bacterium]|jgi:Na+/H+ antiporter NhaD/arsenite permease-like protein|nr:sodium:proton antiporter [Tannerellaceae bacterium]